jgi:hypothetical protein
MTKRLAQLGDLTGMVIGISRGTYFHVTQISYSDDRYRRSRCHRRPSGLEPTRLAWWASTFKEIL